MTNTTPAARFRVEPFSFEPIPPSPSTEFTDFIDANMKALIASMGIPSRFIDEAEARYRLLLYQSPREALAAFIRGTGWEYQGTCGYCDGVKLQTPCPTCHGTGGPPSAETLMVAADWYEERGMTMESEVLRTVAQGARA